MKMKTSVKALLICVCAAALVIASIFGTMAYLTDTQTVTNTFTVGKVDIDLNETKVNPDGTAVTGDAAGKTTSNTYHLIPGHEYTKDPTVTVVANSESCWLFVKVENGIEDIESSDAGYTKIATQIAGNSWISLSSLQGLSDSEKVAVANVYYREVNKSSADQPFKVFDKFKISGSIGNEGDKTPVPTTTDASDLSNFKTGTNNSGAVIKVTAYAIQKDGFENNPYGAWTAGGFASK